MFETKVVQKITTHVLMFDLLFLKYHAVCENVEKYCTLGQATDDNMAHERCTVDKSGCKHTLRVRNTYCFSTTKMVARPSHDVTLYAHGLSCVLLPSYGHSCRGRGRQHVLSNAPQVRNP